MAKRNYIRRKKWLNDSTALVKSTLNFIHTTLGTPVSSAELERLAKQHASGIEAACWDPRTTQLTDSIYQTLMVSKTRELCVALICQNLPEPNAAHILRELRKMELLPPSQTADVVRQAPAFPIPMLDRVDGGEGEAEFEEFEANPVTFGELPTMTAATTGWDAGSWSDE
jgi:hypothetical protein